MSAERVFRAQALYKPKDGEDYIVTEPARNTYVAAENDRRGHVGEAAKAWVESATWTREPAPAPVGETRGLVPAAMDELAALLTSDEAVEAACIAEARRSGLPGLQVPDDEAVEVFGDSIRELLASVAARLSSTTKEQHDEH